MKLNYSYGKGSYKNWIVDEPDFDRAAAGNLESLFCLGNGYMGIRAATEEHYPRETRGFFIAGLFDEFHGNELNLEVSELANCPDWLTTEITLDGEPFSLVDGLVMSYTRRLNMKDGELVRDIKWKSPAGKITRLSFQRFVSMASLHVAGLRINVVPVNYSGKIRIKSGIDGRVSNSGAQHFRAGSYRIFDDGVMYQCSETQESGYTLTIAAKHIFRKDGNTLAVREIYDSPRRQLFSTSEHDLDEGKELFFEKLVCIWTSRDMDAAPAVGTGSDEERVIERSLAGLKRATEDGYDGCVEAHKEQWRAIWEKIAVEIEGNDFDQLAVRFAQFHLLQMAPAHDDSLSIAAKGLSGEGYLGHAFWDTEIFILPFFIYAMPDAARSLLMYRYRTLDGARQNAARTGHSGARFAWESAATGVEATPGHVSIDVVDGLPIAVLTGDLQLHITCDVAYAIWHYIDATGDTGFLREYGAEIVFEIARYWAGRLEFNAEVDAYEVNHIIGPDEYGEDVNNNAYTNYMVKWSLQKAVQLSRSLREEDRALWDRLAGSIGLTVEESSDWEDKSAKIIFRIDESTNIIPQDDSFMHKKEIDVAPYIWRTGSIVRAIGWEEVRKSQVLKQADIIMLLYLLGDQFSEEVKRANFDFYEPKTLHDSSLSPSMHVIVASDMKQSERAYEYFARAICIDLAEMTGTGSSAGLHSASMGGVWQAVVNGFGGLRLENGGLRLSPRLPGAWTSLSFPFYFHGSRYGVRAESGRLTIKSGQDAGATLRLNVYGTDYELEPGKTLTIEYGQSAAPGRTAK